MDETLSNRLNEEKVDEIDLDKTVVICSTRAECADVNEQCLERVAGGLEEYCALDTDHQGHPLRAADQLRINRCRERLPDVLQVKVGARVILRRNFDIEAGWVNETLAVALYPNCIVIQKAANPSDRLPVPRFRQRLKIPAGFLHHTTPAVSTAVGVCSNCSPSPGHDSPEGCGSPQFSFFESGQAYVALSRVTTLDSLTLWDYVPTTITILQFYKDLLSWCDYVDAIRPTPHPGECVPYPATHHLTHSPRRTLGLTTSQTKSMLIFPSTLNLFAKKNTNEAATEAQIHGPEHRCTSRKEKETGSVSWSTGWSRACKVPRH